MRSAIAWVALPGEVVPIDGQRPLLPPPTLRERHELARALLARMLTTARGELVRLPPPRCSCGREVLL